jgi:hypothetical protein
MKRIFSAAALLFLLVLAAPAQERLLPQWITLDTTFYTTAWDSIAVTGLAFQTIRIVVSNDSGTGGIIIARQNDTSPANYVVVKASESIMLPPINNAKYIRAKALTAKVHGRIWIF